MWKETVKNGERETELVFILDAIPLFLIVSGFNVFHENKNCSVATQRKKLAVINASGVRAIAIMPPSNTVTLLKKVVLMASESWK
jgi:hypothetical protein